MEYNSLIIEKNKGFQNLQIKIGSLAVVMNIIQNKILNTKENKILETHPWCYIAECQKLVETTPPLAEKRKICFLAHTSGAAFARLDCSCFPPSYVPKKRKLF